MWILSPFSAKVEQGWRGGVVTLWSGGHTYLNSSEHWDYLVTMTTISKTASFWSISQRGLSWGKVKSTVPSHIFGKQWSLANNVSVKIGLTMFLWRSGQQCFCEDRCCNEANQRRLPIQCCHYHVYCGYCYPMFIIPSKSQCCIWS